MSHHNSQTSSQLIKYSDITIKNKIYLFELRKFGNTDELYFSLNTVLQLKNHSLRVEHQPLIHLLEETSQIARTTFLSCLIEIYGKHLTKAQFAFCGPVTDRYTSLIYDTLLL